MFLINEFDPHKRKRHFFCFPKRFPSLVLRKNVGKLQNVQLESVIYKKDDQGKGQGWWYFQIGPWEETVNRGNFLHNYNIFFLFLRTTSEEPDILSYCPRTTANKYTFLNDIYKYTHFHKLVRLIVLLKHMTSSLSYSYVATWLREKQKPYFIYKAKWY